MQVVKRHNVNANKIFDDIDSAYAILSDKDTPSLISPIFDKTFEPLFNAFEYYGLEEHKVTYKDLNYTPIKPNYNDTMILAFSGGKDSIVSALKYKDEGYNVVLYHLRHINVSLSDEYIIAQESAKMLGLPLYIDDIGFKGHHIWMEHPMKNMIIANGALSYGIREGISTNIAFGNYTTSLLQDNPFERCAGDCMDMWDFYNVIVQRVLPNFKIHCNLANMGETLAIISKHPDLLGTSVSCLCRHSLRDYRHQWVFDKFGVNLPKHRCGSCYKCAVEYIYLADHDCIDS